MKKGTYKNAATGGEGLIRSFIALDLSTEARDELARIIGALDAAGSDVKWSDPANIHITLKFLGDIPQEKVVPVAEAVDDVTRRTGPFTMTLKGIGAFPGWRFPKVVWVGVGPGEEKLKELALNVEDAMVRQAFEREKRDFSAHLTLGRVRKAKNKDKLQQLAAAIEVAPVVIPAKKVILFKSVLTREGPVYTPLHISEISS